MAVRAFCSVAPFMKNSRFVSRVRTPFSVRAFAPASAISLACLLACAAQAQTALKPVVVTASRTEQAVQDALPATTLITRADIERAQTPDLPSLLRTVAGVEIAQNGGQGTIASAFIRGAESRHTLVLIDGVPVNNLNFGTAALEHLPLANVERIEVVRGNVSSLYGSAALGGVIQIFTREGAGASGFSASVQAGSRGLLQASASGSAKLASGMRLSATLESLGDKGFNATNQAQLPATNPDRDGYTRRAISAGIAQDVGAGTVALRVRDARGTTQYDSAFGPATQADESQYAQTGVTLDGQFKLDKNLKLTGALTSSADKLQASVTAFPYFVNSASTGANVGAEWQAAPGQRLTAGLETTRQRIESNTVYNASSRTQNSLRAGYQATLGAAGEHQVQLNVRSDRYSDFGSATTGFAGYAYRLSDAWRVNTSYSTGFTAPTFNDLYFPFGGNAALRPERLKSFELGTQYVMGAHEARALWFSNRYTDLIGNDAFFNRANIASARNQGLEFSYKGRVGSTGLNADLTLQDPKDLGTGKQLARRAKTLAHVGATQDMGAWKLGGNLRASGDRPDGTNTLAAYAVLDATASYALGSELSAFGRVDNLLNKSYQTVYGYNQPGRGLFVGLRWASKP